MTQYKIYGSKVHKYYTVVTAVDPGNAWDYVTDNNNIDWFEVEMDDTIEPYAVEETEQIYELRRTKWTFRTKLWATGPKYVLRGYLQIPEIHI